jgi:hypothetical protein
MVEILTIEEMKERYPDEWVLIGDYQTKPSSLEVVAGRVLAHHKDRDEFDRLIRAQMPAPVSIKCFKELPADTEYLLCSFSGGGLHGLAGLGGVGEPLSE